MQNKRHFSTNARGCFCGPLSRGRGVATLSVTPSGDNGTSFTPAPVEGGSARDDTYENGAYVFARLRKLEIPLIGYISRSGLNAIKDTCVRHSLRAFPVLRSATGKNIRVACSSLSKVGGTGSPRVMAAQLTDKLTKCNRTEINKIIKRKRGVRRHKRKARRISVFLCVCGGDSTKLAEKIGTQTGRAKSRIEWRVAAFQNGWQTRERAVVSLRGCWYFSSAYVPKRKYHTFLGRCAGFADDRLFVIPARWFRK